MSTIQTVAGFSLTNRLLIYASVLLAPAQFASGIGSNCPSNLGFLAYNLYNQISWYQATKGDQLHALSLLPVHFNMFLGLGYLGGISSGNIFMGVFLGLGTAATIVLNTVAAWTAWATDMPEGFGVYQFFFFGWRTLTPGWHTFLLLWQIGDSMTALVFVMAAIYGSIAIPAAAEDDEIDLPDWIPGRFSSLSNYKYPLIPIGAAIMLCFEWLVIMWVELIVARNQIQSDTDWIAVWLFVAQAVTMLVPSCDVRLRRNKT